MSLFMTNRPTKDNTYCGYPFRSVMYLNWDGNVPTSAWPCCFMGGWDTDPKIYENVLTNIEQKTPQDIFDSDTYKQLRYDLSNNIRNPLCSVCWDQEDRGLDSPRFYSQDSFYKEDGDISNIQVKVDNKCNLGCRSCNPSNSSYLGKEWNKEENNGAQSSLAYEWLLENTHKVKILSITGGEPFFSKKFYEIVDRYIETGASKNTKIVVHTNGTLFNKTTIEKLNEFKLLQTTLSIDSVDKNYEYIRHPFKFDRLEDSIDTLLTHSTNHDFVVIALVLTSLNINHLKRHEEWCRITFRNNFKVFYSELWDRKMGISIENLSDEILNIGIKDAETLEDKYADRSRAIQFYKSALTSKPDRKKMLKEIDSFDQKRRQSYKDFVDPQLTEWLS